MAIRCSWAAPRIWNSQTPLPADLKAARDQMEHSGQTTMGVLRNGEWIGLLAAADTLRPDAPKVIADLRALGIEVAMLTGDQPSVAQAIAAQAGVSRVFAGLMPEDKVTIIKQLQAEVGHVAMVGDGVNDAPALALANVGIAMGAAGSDVALETADVVLMGDQLDPSARCHSLESQSAARGMAKHHLLVGCDRGSGHQHVCRESAAAPGCLWA